jgi:hypothetical protein
LSRFQKFLVESDGTALTLDVLIQYGLDERVIWRGVTATGDVVPFFGSVTGVPPSWMIRPATISA